jgi:hypothetical protein
MKYTLLFLILILNSCRPAQLLFGTWQIQSATVIPTQIPSFCDSLLIGDLFIIDKNKFKVVTNNNDTCGEYYYKFNKREKQIEFISGDMICILDSIIVTKFQLSFSNKFTSFPKHTGNQHMIILEHGNTVHLMRK